MNPLFDEKGMQSGKIVIKIDTVEDSNWEA